MYLNRCFEDENSSDYKFFRSVYDNKITNPEKPNLYKAKVKNDLYSNTRITQDHIFFDKYENSQTKQTITNIPASFSQFHFEPKPIINYDTKNNKDYLISGSLNYSKKLLKKTIEEDIKKDEKLRSEEFNNYSINIKNTLVKNK